ncbi:MAG: hypothetical protein ACTHLR_09555, partial [Rhizomicrobium sp.]
RSFSLIGSAGYEEYLSNRFPLVSTKEGIWSGGFRWRPNADSSIVLTYGRYDGKTDFAGEAEVRITPFTVMYAAYTDSISTSQQSLISNNASAILPQSGNAALVTDPTGVVGATYDENPTLAMVNEILNQNINSPTGTETDQDVSLASGLPLLNSNSFYPLQNGLFRAKSLRGLIARNIFDSMLSLSGYHIEQMSLIVPNAPWQKTDGANINYDIPFSPYLVGFASLGYHDSEVINAKGFNLEIGATYLFAENLLGRLKYDLIRQDTNAIGTHSYTQNAVTLTLKATF